MIAFLFMNLAVVLLSSPVVSLTCAFGNSTGITKFLVYHFG